MCGAAEPGGMMLPGRTVRGPARHRRPAYAVLVPKSITSRYVTAAAPYPMASWRSAIFNGAPPER
jgi:hypothetical protein